MDTKERLQQEDIIIDQIKSVLSIANCVIDKNDKKPESLQNVVYASSPVTTGLRMYDLFKKHQVASVEELNAIDKNIFKDQIMKANILDGVEFGREIRRSGYPIVIIPGEFFAKGWAQEHYMSLWEQVITQFSNIICFNNNWYYSNGCVEEFLIGLQHKNKLLHRDLSWIEPGVEISKIREAIDGIDNIGGNPNRLYDLYRRIELFTSAPKIFAY